MPSGSSSNRAQQRWIEISVEAAEEAIDDLLRLLNLHCQGGAVLDQSISPLSGNPDARAVVKGFLPVWEEETGEKLEIALLLLSRSSPISEPRVRILEPEDWAESWKAFFPPLLIGERTVIVPTWESHEAQPGQTIIRLDPGMAFGTGLHATTRLCLMALESLSVQGAKVLDVGTGSGILAVAAALEGAASVQALDTDEVAVQSALSNVALNHVEDRVHVAHATLGTSEVGDIPIHSGSGYDLLLVNILAEIIIGMAPALYAALRPGGTMVGSGIIEEKAQAVVRALESAGLILETRDQQDHWVSVTARRP